MHIIKCNRLIAIAACHNLAIFVLEHSTTNDELRKLITNIQSKINSPNIWRLKVFIKSIDRVLSMRLEISNFPHTDISMRNVLKIKLMDFISKIYAGTDGDPRSSLTLVDIFQHTCLGGGGQ